jgi:hypothetical protein
MAKKAEEMLLIICIVVPARTDERRPRPSHPLFDIRCRQAKCMLRRLERMILAAAQLNDVVAATAAIRLNFTLSHLSVTALGPQELLWCITNESYQKAPKVLWPS